MGKERRFYPLVMKPGIQLDGSENESLCPVDGNWIRFVRGRAQTMGGITSSCLNFFYSGKGIFGEQGGNIFFRGNYITNIKAFSWKRNDYLFVSYLNYVDPETGEQAVGFYIFEYKLNLIANNSFDLIPIINYETANVSGDITDCYFLFEGPFNLNELPQDISINAASYSGDYFYAHLVHDSSNILNDSPTQLYLLDFSYHNFDPYDQDGPEEPNNDVFSNNSFIKNYPPDNYNFNGGILVQEDLFFAYGEGKFIYSRFPDFRYSILESGGKLPEPVTSWVPLPGSSYKTIKAAFIRGGGNSPTILFWSLSSLMKAINVAETGSYDFKMDLVSNQCSVLSRESIVEYDGLFYWPGIDRFFVYNGTIQELPNDFNRNDFFENIDMTQRQNVVGVVNPRYGEIWWFYPDERFRPQEERADGSTQYFDGNTAAIVYNKRENCWYSVKGINRDAASFSSKDGFFFTAGCDDYSQGGADKDIYNFTKNYAQIYIHDTPLMEKRVGMIIENGGNYKPIYAYKQIEAWVTTPFVSWKFLSPGAQNLGINRQINLVCLEPDVRFISPEGTTLNSFNSVKVTPQSKKYLMNEAFESVEVREITEDVNQLTYSTTSNSYINIDFSSTVPFELGTCLLQFEFEGEK